MKNTGKLLLALVLLLTVALLTVSCNKDASVPDGMKQASGAEADFTLFVPEDWTVDMATAAVSAYVSQSDPSSVSMMVWELKNVDTNLEDWWEVNREEVEKVFSNVEVTGEENLTVDSLNAKKYEYSADLGDNSYRIMQVACIKNSAVYLFTYTSIPATYDSHLDDVNAILNHVKIGK